MPQPYAQVQVFDSIPTTLVPHLRAAAEEVARDLLAGVDPGDTARRVMTDGLHDFCDLVQNAAGDWPRVAARYRTLGAASATDGDQLLEIHQALRGAARAVLRGVPALTEELGLDDTILDAVTTAQFGFLDAVFAMVADGRAEALRKAPDATALHRSRLLSLLLEHPPADPDEVFAAARVAGWKPPSEVAAVIMCHRGTGDPRTRMLLPAGLLADFGRTEPVLLLPDPEGPGRAEALQPLLRDWMVAIGTTEPLARVSESLRWAEQALALARRGIVPSDGLIHSTEHVATLVIFGAEALIDNAAAIRLAPLDTLSATQRDRLSETLLALLQNNFNATEAGNRLRVHPQTVRYRLRHLEELFGDDLQDPGRCLEMEMILYARSATARRTARPARERGRPRTRRHARERTGV